MLRTALRNVLAQKSRLVMTGLAVMLGVAFVSGTLIFGTTVTQAFRAASTASLEDVAVAVQIDVDTVPVQDGDGVRNTVITNELTDRIRALPDVTYVRPMVSGTATLAAKDGRPVNADNSWQNLATNYVPDARGTNRDSRFPIAAGRGPIDHDEIALDRRTAKRAGYRVGDTVRFATEGPTLTKKLVGTVRTDDPRVTAGGTLALFDTRTAQRLFLRTGRFDELAIGSEPGTDNEALTKRIRDLLPGKGATAASGARLASEQAQDIADSTKALTKTLLAFAGVALFVGVFIIVNTFTMLVSQRSREIALLRAVGASRRQVVRMVLVEAGFLGLGASVVGFALGLGVAAGMRPLLNAGGAGLPDGPLVITAEALGWSLVVGVLVTVLAAWLPSRKAARIAPLEALSTVDQAPPARGLLLRNVLGGLISGAGVLVMLYVSTLDDGSNANLMLVAVGSVLVITGLSVLAPLLSKPLIHLTGKITIRLFAVSGKLAQENALRNPRRTAATASALMFGLTLVTGLSVVGSSTDAALRQEAVRGLTADYKVSNASHNGIDPALANAVAKVPDVGTAAFVASTVLETKDASVLLTGADPAALGKVADMRFISGSLTDIEPGRIALSDVLARQTGLAKGDTVEGRLGYGNKRTRLTVVGVYEETRAVDDAVGILADVLPHSMGGRLDSILLRATDDPDTARLERDVREALGNSPLLEVRDREQLTRAEAGTVDVTLNMLYGLLGMAVVIAVLGVVNTLVMSVVERTREIGMLRAIGLDRADVARMIRLESVVISLFGAVLGISTGVFLAWSSSSLTGGSLATYETVLPWGRLGLFLVLSLVIGVLAAIWPARRAARLNMLRSVNPR